MPSHPVDTVRTRVRRNPALTRSRIMAAARAEFCERGFFAARVDEIAAAANINKRMLYHYFGAKQDLYRAVLLEAYTEIRTGEKTLNLANAQPSGGMEELVRFTFRHFITHPWFVRLLIHENINEARTLRELKEIKEMHSPLVAQIRDLLRHGEKSGVFRTGIDPIELYITIASLGFFYLSNVHTLSTIFGEDLSRRTRMKRREDHIVEVVMQYVLKAPS